MEKKKPETGDNKPKVVALPQSQNQNPDDVQKKKPIGKKKILSVNQDPLAKFDFEAVEAAMQNLKNQMRSYDRMEGFYKKKNSQNTNKYFQKFFALKKPDGDLLSLNKLDQNVEMAVESFESTNSGMNRTQSEIDFIDLVRTRLNEKDAHKITKKGYQFNQQEMLEALSIKNQLKKFGRIEARNSLTSLNKTVHKSIQIDQEASQMIDNFILSIDPLSHIQFDPERECFMSRSFNNQIVSQQQNILDFENTESSVKQVADSPDLESRWRDKQSEFIEIDMLDDNMGLKSNKNCSAAFQSNIYSRVGSMPIMLSSQQSQISQIQVSNRTSSPNKGSEITPSMKNRSFKGSVQISQRMSKIEEEEESIQVDNLTDKEWIEKLLHSDLKFCQYETFKKVIKNPDILNKVSLHLMSVHGCEHGCASINPSFFTRNEIDYALSQTDKDLFLRFRDKKLTFDQLRARTAQKNGYATYVVLDDIRDILHPKILENKKELAYMYEIINNDYKYGTKTFFEKLQGLESWEADSHCVRSMTYKPNKKKEEENFEIPKVVEKQEEEAPLEKAETPKRAETCQKQQPTEKVVKETETLPKRKPGESIKEYDSRVRQKKMSLHFNKYVRWHQHGVRNNTAFHNSKYDKELQSDPEWSKFLNQQKAKKGLLPKQEPSKCEKPPTSHTSVQKKQSSNPTMEKNLLQFLPPSLIKETLSFLFEKQAPSFPQHIQPPDKSGSTSERLNVSYINFAKPYERRNQQRIENQTVLLKEQKMIQLEMQQEEKKKQIIKQIKDEIEQKYRNVAQANGQSIETIAPAKRKTQSLHKPLQLGRNQSLAQTNLASKSTRKQKIAFLEGLQSSISQIATNQVKVTLGPQKICKNVNVEDLSRAVEEYVKSGGRVIGMAQGFGSPYIEEIKKGAKGHEVVDKYDRKGVYLYDSNLNHIIQEEKDQEGVNMKLAYLRALSSTQIECNATSKLMSLVEAQDPDLLQSVLKQFLNQQNSAPKFKDVETLKNEKLDEDMKHVRDLIFLKRFKEMDNRDIKISQVHRNLIQIDDQLLKAMNEDVSSPRTILKRIKQVQARRDAVHQNKTEEPQKIEKSNKKEDMFSLDNDIEYINPDMKQSEIKAQKSDSICKIMEIESQLKLDQFINKMKKNYCKDDICKLKHIQRQKRQPMKKTPKRPETPFDLCSLPVSQVLTPKMITTIKMGQIGSLRNETPRIEKTKSQKMFETKTFVQKQQVKKMNKILEKEENVIQQKQNEFLVNKAAYKSSQLRDRLIKLRTSAGLRNSGNRQQLTESSEYFRWNKNQTQNLTSTSELNIKSRPQSGSLLMTNFSSRENFRSSQNLKRGNTNRYHSQHLYNSQDDYLKQLIKNK